MASYKVPQDVEADDKLLGPFSFRQFVYLMIVGGAIFVAFLLFQIFPLLAIAPLPVIIFFTVLALPIKKDQPMETYLAAIISFYLKPNRRFWIPGQSDSTILITTPKKVETSRIRNITGEEATHRLSFLANIVDTEGQAIKNINSPMRDEFYAEASNTTDMFDRTGTTRLSNLITKEQEQHHAEVINQMRAAIRNSAYNPDRPLSQTHTMPSQHVIQPLSHPAQPNPIIQPTPITPTAQPTIHPPQPLNRPNLPPTNPNHNLDTNHEVYIPLR